MATDNWNDGSANWNTATDWSGGVPTSASNVVVSQGDPRIGRAISIASLLDSATVTFADAGSSDVSGALSVLGQLLFDAAPDQGGSSLSIGGALTDSGAIDLGNSMLLHADTVRAASLMNTGTLDLAGGASASAEMLLDVAGAAGFGTAGVLSGAVSLSGHAEIEFGSGEITGIGLGMALTLNGPNAFIADAGAPGSNSALTGLNNVRGKLTLENGSQLATAGDLFVGFFATVDVSGGSSLTVGGALTIEGPSSVQLAGPSRLTVDGTLTNERQLSVGAGAVLAAHEFVNEYVADVQDGATVEGPVTNNFVVSVSGGTAGGSAVFDGPVTGQGNFMFLATGSAERLKFESSVASGQTVDFTAGNQELILGPGGAKDFAGAINGFQLASQLLDVQGFGAGTTMSFAENSTNSAGVLTLTNGANVAHVAINGSYTSSDFSLTTSHADSFVRFV